MGFKCGIVGLPNVGKSTLFNALTATAAAEAANFPFCTIEPNIGRVAVPDTRLNTLAKIAASKDVIPTQLEFVDIAGLVRGASKGEGLGNQFLGHIREVDAIIQVLRCFEDPDITHVEQDIDPIRDFEIITAELILADLEVLERRLGNIDKQIRRGDSEAKAIKALAVKIIPTLEAGKMAKTITFSESERPLLKQLGLITTKPMLIVANVLDSEAATGNALTQKVIDYCEQQQLNTVIISSQIEAEISSLESEEEKAEFLSSIDLAETGLNKIIRAGYELLNLSTYFTAGPKECRAWTIPKDATAPQAAGVIHTDFAKGFIRAEVISYNDYVQYQGEAGAKEAGRMRSEGKDYLVKDGDVIHFRFNV